MRFKVLLGALSFTMGCGVPVPNTAPATYTDYLKASSQLTCAAALGCCGTVCSTTTDAAFYQTAARTLDYIGQGLIGYDATAAQTCLLGLSKRYAMCDAPAISLPVPPACTQVLLPKSPVGGPCEAGVSACVPDSFCRVGRCVAAGQLGMSCTTSQGGSCAGGLFCSSSTFTCMLTIAAGQTCTGAIPCVAGTYCGGTLPLSCMPYGQTGQACSDTKPCDPTASLVCSAAGTCQPPLVAQTIREQLCALK